VSHCIGACPHPCVAPPLLAAIYQADQENHHTGSYISATMLTGKASCARRTVLERTTDYRLEPRDRYWSFRGVHAHSIIEGAYDVVAPFGWLQELRLTATLEYDDGTVVQLGGTCDAYHPVQKVMYDFKSMADTKAAAFISGKPVNKWADVPTYSPHLDDGWVRQLNIYRWLMSKTRIPDEIRAALAKQGIEIESDTYPVPEQVFIQGIAMMELPLSGQEYWPQRAKEGSKIDHVPLLPLDDVEAMIRPHARDWHSYLVEGVYPPIVDEEDKWLCNFCAFNGERYANAPCRPVQERLERALLEDED
jgi:hypothetical protein